MYYRWVSWGPSIGTTLLLELPTSLELYPVFYCYTVHMEVLFSQRILILISILESNKDSNIELLEEGRQCQQGEKSTWYITNAQTDMINMMS